MMKQTEMPSSVRIDWQPIGRRVDVPAGTTLLDAARAAGIELVSICGGVGTCGECRVRIVEGRLSPLSLSEESELSAEEIAAGFRLACQAEVRSPARIEVPPESLTTPQRLQVEGQEWPLELDPLVRPVEVTIPAPNLHDLRSDEARVRDVLAEAGCREVRLGLPLMAEMGAKLRAWGWKAVLALRDGEVVAALPVNSRLAGLAVDVGTTKLAAYLVDLDSGETLARAGAMNPQIAYGEDVVSRIAYTNTHADGRVELQRRLVETLNQLAGELCAQARLEREQIVEVVVVGNTAMHHLFAGLPVTQLGEAPYVPAASGALDFPARQVGLEAAAGAHVYLPPNIAGYVGADHTAMLLATRAGADGRTAVALDIGTNTEISLFHAGEHWSCSCASGPAFEGAHIRDGMRAAPGAIERVRIQGEQVLVYTIGGAAAVGICGSGILDAVAELIKAGLVDSRGALKGEHPRLRRQNGQGEFILATGSESGNGRDVVVTRQDVNEIQLAKGAIRAGVEVLLREAGIGYEDVQDFIIAGAFGTYLDLESALRVGMFPPLPPERFRQAGNAAGMGAKQLLISKKTREKAAEMVRDARYVELTTHPAFADIYVRALSFEG